VRTIAAADSSYFSLTTKGWQGDGLTWIGTQSIRGATLKIKQEIIRKGQNAFSAIFYVRREGKWTVTMKEELERMPGE
jgi:hypothetical protein